MGAENPFLSVVDDRSKRLPGSAAIEFGAQAIALHGALSNTHQSGKPQKAFIASLKNAEWSSAPLSDCHSDLTIQAECIAEVGAGAEYSFSVRNADNVLAQGNAIVMFSFDEQG
jgi:predicted hotdog family 3-hydroxylacyl-ACP dehydratase